MYQRAIEPAVRRYAAIYPAVFITGPRQSGKSTLARLLFPDKPYISFEDLDNRLRAQTDARGFLRLYEAGAIFDEVQHVPQLLSYLQGVIDERRHDMGRFILTGSQHFVLTEQISQSLAGRVGVVTLLPLTRAELGGTASWESLAVNGSYPALHYYGMTQREFYASYVHTYVQRDVRQVLNIENLQLFSKFLMLCAGRVGQLLNMQSLAIDCGISPHTARAWLGVLEASYIIHIVHPYYQNLGKRVTKMPKLYFCDTGLATYVLGITSEEQLAAHYIRGSLFENVVVTEILKQRLNKGLDPHLYFWRDQTGREVDVVAEWEGRLVGAEIKASHTFNPDDLAHLRTFATLVDAVSLYAIYAGDQGGSYQGIELVSFADVERLEKVAVHAAY